MTANEKWSIGMMEEPYGDMVRFLFNINPVTLVELPRRSVEANA